MRDIVHTDDLNEYARNNTHNSNHGQMSLRIGVVRMYVTERVPLLANFVWRNWKLTDCERRNARCEVMCVRARKILRSSEENWTILWRNILKVNNTATGESCRIASLLTISARYSYNNPYTAQVYEKLYVTVRNRKTHYYIFIFELNVNHHKPEIMFAPRHITLEWKNEMHELA